MAAIILDGKKIAMEIREELKKEVAVLKENNINPRLAVILAGDDPASVVYARSKEKACQNTGIIFDLHVMPASVTQKKMLGLIEELNRDSMVHAIMIELPLPPQLDRRIILETVSPVKDVDGNSPVNRGRLAGGAEGLFPATPLGCVELLERFRVDMKGKHAVIAGRGDTVGKPLFFMLLSRHATVTVCHTRTRELQAHTKRADILVAAAGKPGLIIPEMIKPGAIVLDTGINEVDGRICGDVDFEGARLVAGMISPVPGGVGSMTTVMIQKNVLKAIKLQGIAKGE